MFHRAGCYQNSHSHKKSKRNAGAPSPCANGSLIFKQSPQRKMMSANKRVSVHSPLCLPVCQAEELLSSDGSYSLDSSKDEVLIVGIDTGKDTCNNLETSFVVSINCRNIVLCNKCLEARGRCRYSSPLARDHVGCKAGGHSSTGKANGFFSNGSWTNNNDDVDMSLVSDGDTCPLVPNLYRPAGALHALYSCVLLSRQLCLGRKDLPELAISIGRRQIFLTGSGQDLTISPCSPAMFCVTLQDIRWRTSPLHIGKTLDCWNTQIWSFA